MKPILIFFSLFAALAAVAHPGGLDANGGHTDRKTGIYHYHRGTNAPSGKLRNASPVVVETDRSEVATTTVEPNKPDAGVASTLRNLPWWVYLLGLGGGYAIWETAWYFWQRRGAKR
jgi:hypothetical protein